MLRDTRARTPFGFHAARRAALPPPPSSWPSASPSFAVEDDVQDTPPPRRLEDGTWQVDLLSPVYTVDREYRSMTGPWSTRSVAARRRRRVVLGPGLQRGDGRTGRHHARVAGVHVPQQPRLRSDAPPAGVRRLEVAHQPAVHVVAGPARDRVSRRLRHAASRQRAALAHDPGAQPQSDRRVGRRAPPGEHPLREAGRARQADEAAVHERRLRPAAPGRGRTATSASSHPKEEHARSGLPAGAERRPRTSSATRRAGSSRATGW